MSGNTPSQKSLRPPVSMVPMLFCNKILHKKTQYKLHRILSVYLLAPALRPVSIPLPVSLCALFQSPFSLPPCATPVLFHAIFALT